MNRQREMAMHARPPAGGSARERLLAGIPVTEQRVSLAGISTAVLEGGADPPVVLLHGAGEFAAGWLRVMPELMETHRVVAPDLDRARTPGMKAALRSLVPQLGLPAIPSVDLARVPVPTTLIWGRHDRQARLRLAEAASARYGWALHVIEGAADDPAAEQPAAFLAALRPALDPAPRPGMG